MSSDSPFCAARRRPVGATISTLRLGRGLGGSGRTDKGVYRFLRLALELGQFLVQLALEVPIWPFWCDVEQVLRSTSHENLKPTWSDAVIKGRAPSPVPSFLRPPQ